MPLCFQSLLKKNETRHFSQIFVKLNGLIFLKNVLKFFHWKIKEYEDSLALIFYEIFLIFFSGKTMLDVLSPFDDS